MWMAMQDKLRLGRVQLTTAMDIDDDIFGNHDYRQDYRCRWNTGHCRHRAACLALEIIISHQGRHENSQHDTRP